MSDSTITDLQRRALRHGWRLTEEAGELVLLGNGAPAAFRSAETCAVWLDAQERAKPARDDVMQADMFQEAA